MSGLAQDHALLIEAVRSAGPTALHYFHGEVESWEKGPGDPVSEADHAIDDVLKSRLTTARPDYGWLSEETEDDPARLERQRVWVVDPIDGTRAFLQKKPEFTISAALVEDGRPVAGVVFNPATDELFEALHDGGARLNGEPITVSDRADFHGAKLLSGSRMFERAGWAAPPKDLAFAAINSIAYRMALVACGRYDGCVSLNTKSDWDIAAGELIAQEAGGRTSDARGHPLTYNDAEPLHNSVIVAGPALHDHLMEFLATVKRPAGVGW